MGTELIMGMEEVINYLKELEEKNKKLQEDLKTQTTRADAWEKSYYSECEVRQSDMYRVKEENKKLQEKYDNMCEVRYSVSEMRQEQVRRLTEEIKKLTEEINQYKNESCESLVKEQKLYGQLFQFQEEIKKLTEEINQYKNESCESLVKEQKLYGQLFQFQEENKKLKEKQEYFRVRNCDRMEELVKALSPWKKNHSDHKRILEAIGELKEENKKLKEENKKLKEDLKEELGETQMANKELWRQVVNLHARLDCLPDNIKWIPEARHGGGVWTFSEEESD